MSLTNYEHATAAVLKSLAFLRDVVAAGTPDLIGQCRIAAAHGGTLRPLALDLDRLTARWRQVRATDERVIDAQTVATLFVALFVACVNRAGRLADSPSPERAAEQLALLDAELCAVKPHEAAFARAMATCDPERAEGGVS